MEQASWQPLTAEIDLTDGLLSSPESFRNFTGSSGWKDILKFIDERIDLYRTQLENPLMTTEATGLLRGAIMELRIIKEFPDAVTKQLDTKKEAEDA